jgi:hypothetical protein
MVREMEGGGPIFTKDNRVRHSHRGTGSSNVLRKLIVIHNYQTEMALRLAKTKLLR